MAKLPEDLYKASQQNQTGSRALILTANNTNDVEFFYPYYRLIEAGFNVDVATPKGKELKCDNGAGLKETKKIEDVRATDYQLLYIPGGKAPAELKDNDAAKKITKQFVESGKTIAAFCHGPQLLAAAGVIDGREITAWPDVQEEVEDAGANYVNKETAIDGQFITGRWPADLPAFTAQVLKSSGKTVVANKAA